MSRYVVCDSLTCEHTCSILLSVPLAGDKEEAGVVRDRYLGYWAVHLGMMGEDGRTEAAPDEPHRRGAAALLSCAESLHGYQDQCCAQPVSFKWHALSKDLACQLSHGCSKRITPVIIRMHGSQMPMPAGQTEPLEGLTSAHKAAPACVHRPVNGDWARLCNSCNEG